MKKSTVPWILALLALNGPTLVSADVVTPPRKGTTHVAHKIQIDGLKKHSRFSLVIHDPPTKGKIRASLVFHADRAAVQLLVRGGSWRSEARFGRPRIWLMPRAHQKRWSEATAREISKQRTACAEHGKGCAHISRFSPRFAPPTGAIDCGVSITVHSSVPTRDANKARQVVDRYRIVKASNKVCKLAHVKRATPTRGK